MKNRNLHAPENNLETDVWSFLAVVSQFEVISTYNLQKLAKRFKMEPLTMAMLIEVYGGNVYLNAKPTNHKSCK